ncbi:MAG: putative metal-dependent hydrolase [Thermoanaerobaculia bacterium]|nr:putative metal-dependent hydrolase [Thermoanaerobaculia bacterium]
MDLRYPIGRFSHPGPVTAAEVEGWIAEMAALPDEMRRVVSPLTQAQLDTRYRPGGWTLRQVVHHVPDSHLNSYIRFKWALTEEEPAIKTYFEERWALLEDYRLVPVEASLDFLAALHLKLTTLLRSLDPDQLSRTLLHPELGRVRLDWYVGFYAWHGRHHLAHITTTVERHGW